MERLARAGPPGPRPSARKLPQPIGSSSRVPSRALAALDRIITWCFSAVRLARKVRRGSSRSVRDATSGGADVPFCQNAEKEGGPRTQKRSSKRRNTTGREGEASLPPRFFQWRCFKNATHGGAEKERKRKLGAICFFLFFFFSPLTSFCYLRRRLLLLVSGMGAS